MYDNCGIALAVGAFLFWYNISQNSAYSLTLNFFWKSVPTQRTQSQSQALSFLPPSRSSHRLVPLTVSSRLESDVAVLHYLSGYFKFLIIVTLRAKTFDALDLDGHITIRWDIMHFTTYGYKAEVKINNHQLYCNFESPGWRLNWTWEGNEIIRQMEGARISQIGYCSQHISPQPVFCIKTQVVEDYCKRGILTAIFQDSTRIATSFRIRVGNARRKGRFFTIPKNYTIMAPKMFYKCGSPTVNKRRFHLSRSSWIISCTYTPYTISEHCAVVVSSFNRKTEIIPACLRQPQIPCPIKVSWHVKTNRLVESKVLVRVINRGLRTYSN